MLEEQCREVTSRPCPLPMTSRVAWHLWRTFQQDTGTDHSVMILVPKTMMMNCLIDGALAVIPPQLALKVVELVLKELKGRGREASASNQELLSSGSRHVRPFTA